MSSLAVSRSMLVSGSRALLTSSSSTSRASGFATVATSFSPPSGDSSPSSRDTSSPSASFPSPWFMPPPPPLPTTPSSPSDVATRPSSPNRIGRPAVEISYELTMEGSRAEKGLDHFVAMAAKEGEEKGGKGEKKPCTKTCANCKKVEAVA